MPGVTPETVARFKVMDHPADLDPLFEHEIPVLSRRRILGLLGCAGAGGLFLPGEAEAATWVRGNSAAAAVWNRFLDDYAAFLAKQRLRNISVKQVIFAHLKMRGKVRNTPPPRSMWKNIVPTLRVADRMARELNSPVVEIVSAYRSPSYNACCPGAKRDSMHKRNLALDLKFGTSPQECGRHGRENALPRLFPWWHRPLWWLHPRGHAW